jgi:type I restriction enzyme S subunit
MREDWIECTLDDLLTLKNGFAFKSSKYINHGIPVIRIGDINDWIVDETHAKCVAENKEYDNYIVENGDILIAMSGATTGKFGIYESENKAYQNQRVGNLKPHSKNLIDKKYVFNLLYSLKYQIEKEAYGGAQPNISAGKIHAMRTLLAPLPEQRAIVSKIEELFSDLDKGIDDLKKAKDQLVIYRQAVLKKAFDLDSKKYKIEKICKEIFAGGDKPKDYFSATKTKELTIPIIANAVEKKGLYGYTKMARVTEKAITIAGRGSGTGHVVLRNEPFFPIVRLITIIPNFDIVAIEYLMYFLKNLNIKGSGSAIPQLTIPMVKGFEIYLPSIPIQRQIVKEIESRLSVCDKVEQSIIESLEKAKALRQSILKKAFEGKLLSATEIARCKQEQDYEPASVLLKKINAEKNKK